MSNTQDYVDIAKSVTWQQMLVVRKIAEESNEKRFHPLVVFYRDNLPQFIIYGKGSQISKHEYTSKF